MSRHKELRLALAIAAVLVLARSLVYAAFEHAHFDSDQAIVGLMAKHLSEGRAFPLFFYGQAFMLGVESWLAAPVMWILGPTVAALKASLILTNLGAVMLLVAGLHRWGGLRPFHALAASVFFTFAPPWTAARLVEAQGGNIEPFLYVLLLWWLRARPIWFGVLLAIGFMNREFTIYAVPILLLGQMWTGEIWRADTWKRWLLSAVAFGFVWQGVHAIEPLADMAGPGTRGELLGGFSGSEVGNLADRVNLNVTETPGRIGSVFGYFLPALIGGRVIADTIAKQGRDWVLWPMAIASLAGLLRLLALSVPGPRSLVLGRSSVPGRAAESAAFGWYLLGVGLLAALAYALTRPPDFFTLRYTLLSLFIPVGLVAVWLALEPRASVRYAVVALTVAWCVLSGIDNLRQAERYVGGHEANELRAVADALVARGVQVAEAPYWRAYKITFLARERVKIASTDFVRISEYQRLAAAAGKDLRRLQDQPCGDGELLAAGWYLCK